MTPVLLFPHRFCITVIQPVGQLPDFWLRCSLYTETILSLGTTESVAETSQMVQKCNNFGKTQEQERDYSSGCCCSFQLAAWQPCLSCINQSWDMAKEKLCFWNGPEKILATLVNCWEQGLGFMFPFVRVVFAFPSAVSKRNHLTVTELVFWSVFFNPLEKKRYF